MSTTEADPLACEEIVAITVNCKKKRIFFTEEDDIDLLGLVTSENPFLYHKKWHDIADILRSRKDKDFTAKNVRDRVQHLLDTFRHKLPKSTPSGKEEGYGEKEQRLASVRDLKAFADKHPALVVTIKKSKHFEKEGRNVGKEVRKSDKDEAANFLSLQNFSVEVVDEDDERVLDGEVIAPASGSRLKSIHPPPDDVGSCGLPPGDWESSEHPLNTHDYCEQRPHTPSGSSTSSPASQFDQQLREKIRSDGEYLEKTYKLQLLQAENEKKRLEVEEVRVFAKREKRRQQYEIECKRIKLEEEQQRLIEQQNAMLSNLCSEVVGFIKTLNRSD